MPKAKTPAVKTSAAPAATPPRASAPAESSQPPAGVEAARGPLSRLRDAPDTAPVVAIKIYCNAYSTGPRGSLLAMPLHEIPLARRKVVLLGQELKIDPSWPKGGLERAKGMTGADLANEYSRLREHYVFTMGDDQVNKYDLVSELYGQPHERRLIAIIRRMHAAYEKLRVAHQDDGEKPWQEDEWEGLVALAEPEQDFIHTPA